MPGLNRGALFWGWLLIVLGVGFLLENFRFVPEATSVVWSLLVIGLGVWMLGRTVMRREGRGLVAGMLVLAVGVFWLLEAYGKVNDRMFLPILLIALGLGWLWRNFYQSQEA